MDRRLRRVFYVDHSALEMMEIMDFFLWALFGWDREIYSRSNNRGDVHRGNGVGGDRDRSGGGGAAVGEGGEEGIRLDRVKEKITYIYRERESE